MSFDFLNNTIENSQNLCSIENIESAKESCGATLQIVEDQIKELLERKGSLTQKRITLATNKLILETKLIPGDFIVPVYTNRHKNKYIAYGQISSPHPQDLNNFRVLVNTINEVKYPGIPGRRRRPKRELRLCDFPPYKVATREEIRKIEIELRRQNYTTVMPSNTTSATSDLFNITVRTQTTIANDLILV